eukprot:scaffold7068_cov107-Skeletonema_dohrnii-CCMP3373.AAC.4
MRTIQAVQTDCNRLKFRTIISIPASLNPFLPQAISKSYPNEVHNWEATDGVCTNQDQDQECGGV